MQQDLKSKSFNNYPNNRNRYDVCVDILKAIADLSSILLIDENLDRSVNKALKILGTSIAADRLNLHKHYDDPTGETLGYVAAKYEWISDGTRSQIDLPQLNQISYNGIEDCYHLMLKGKHWGGFVDALPEPFKSGQLQLGVKATYAIPIEVNHKYWGIIGLDFCKLARRLEESEIEVLKTAATCIGSAIEKERIVREREKIVKEVSLAKQEAKILTKKDRILALTTDVARILLDEESLEKSIFKALQIVGKGIDTDRVVVMEHRDDSTEASLGYLQMLHEWHSSVTISQLHHSNLNQISYEGIENWYEELNKGNVMGGIVEYLPEPVRSGQKKLGVLSTYAIPIAINGKYWGIVGFDDCREAKQRSQEEISILKTTAICIGSAIAKNRVRQERERAERNILLEQQKAAQLAKHNQILEQRDRILMATAEASNILLTEDNFDLAVNRALEIIGVTLNTDRVVVIENWHNPSNPNIPSWRLLYEWDSPQTISQISHPELTQGNYEGIEEWYALQNEGKSISYRLAQMPEPFRSGQAKLGVKVLHAVPVFIEGKHWGMIGFDDCHRETNRSEAELSILKTLAACIGGAIEKERIRRGKEEAEKAILLEREKAALEKTVSLLKSNQILSSRDRWLEATAHAANKLLKNADLEEGINAALQVLGESLDCDRVNIMKHHNDRKEFVRMLYEWDSPHAISQMSHSELNEISSEGIEDWFAILKAGGWIGGTIDEFGEPFRSGQIELGVKATHSVPIFVNNIYWGAICIDFCREPRRLTEPEVAVFKTAASCIGSAIYRQQIQQEKESAELAILDERNRMAREIHDTLAQAFTGISLQLEAAKNNLSTQPDTARERLIKAKQLAKEGIAEARRSVRALRPETLESNSLETAIQQLVDNMTSGTAIATQITIEDKLQLAPDIEVDLYRIVQEAITNTLRHAEATKLTIRLVYRTNLVELQIKDNGIGFELNRKTNDHFGLIGMQERCDRHHGNLIINSQKNRGTEITVTVPV